MTSPDVQRHAIQSYADQTGITIIDWVEGIDESGSKSRSAWWPKLNAAIDRVQAGDADTIIVWKYSRTARNRLRWAVAVDRMDILGGSIVSATEPIDDATASGRFARGMLGELNAYQADLIGETWKETLDRRVRAGLPGTGRPRFGYLLDGTYTPDPQTAPLVREMYQRALAGHGMAAITRWLNSHGQVTRYGNPWSTTGIRQYMDRGFAAGFIWSKGHLHPGAHQPIITADTWGAFTALRARPNAAPRGGIRMLSGMLKCGTCGGPMMSVQSSGEHGSYACARRARGTHCPSPVNITRRIAEHTVSAWVQHLPVRADELAAVVEAERRQRLTQIEDREALTRMIARAEQRLAAVTMKLVDGQIPQLAYDAATTSLTAEIASLQLRHTATVPKPQRDIITLIPALVEGWDSATPAAQNRALRALVDRIIVSKGRGPGRIQIIPAWDD